MRLEPPGWWYTDEPTLTARLMSPAGALVAELARRRMASSAPYRSRLPVICIGNLTAGGAGKTPLALAIAGLLSRARRKPAFLTRGFGGRERGPHVVDPAKDGPRAVGDEALLLARRAPTVVARDRAAGAKAIETLGADVIVMDDGLQNQGLAKSFAIAVLDPKRLVGNGLVMPAGPLRAALPDQLRATHALVVLCGPGEPAPVLAAGLKNFKGPVLRAELRPNSAVAARLKGERVVAYAGIGRPSKLFDTLRALGAVVAAEAPFPDHHVYDDRDAERLMALANAQRALLVTTEKDLARMLAGGLVGDLARASLALPVTATFEGREFDRLVSLLDLAIS